MAAASSSVPASEPVQAELSLRASEAMYRTLVEQSPDIIMRFDRNYRHLYVNPAATRLTGLSTESFLGRTHAEIGFEPGLCQFWESKIQAVIDTGAPVRMDFEYQGPNGLIVFDWCLIPEVTADGVVHTVLSVSRDITEIKKSMAVVKEKTRQYSMLFEEMIGGFALHEIICNPAGEPVDYRFLQVNPAFERMTGLSAAQVVGRTATEVLPGIEPNWVQRYGQVALTGKSDEFISYTHSLGRYYEVRAYCPEPGKFATLFHDVSDRKRAEAALRESEERHRTLFGAMSEGFALCEMIYGEDGGAQGFRFLEANPAFERLIGLQSVEIIGRTSRDVFDPDFYADGMVSFAAVALAGHSVCRQFYSARVDRHFEISAFSPALGRLGLLLIDITEQKRTEEELKRLNQNEKQQRQLTEEYSRQLETEHQRLLTVLLNMPAGVMIFDAVTGQLTMANVQAERMVGEQLIPDHHQVKETGFQLFHPDGRPYPPDEWPRVRTLERGELIDNEEIILRRRDGSTVHLSISSAPLFDQNGGVTTAIVIGNDLSALRRTEAALQESERRFRDILQNLQLVAVMVDNVGNITFCNDYLARITGWSKQEIIGANWFDLFVPAARREALRDFFTQAISQGDYPAHTENSYQTRRGDERLIAWDNTLLRDPEGRVVGVAGLGRDITDQRRLEEQYRQAQKMEAVGQLAGGVAHDFNNLLQVITGYMELILTQLEPDQFPYRELTEIQKAASRATSLVRQLLAFSRRETMRCENLDLDRLIINLVKMLRRVIGEHIALGTVTHGRLPSIYGDPGHIEQALLNLCVNARDAMPDGGRLGLEVRLTQRVIEDEMGLLGVGPPDAGSPGVSVRDYVVLSVSDTGTGMPPEVLEHIFEPFFTTKGVGRGTGLGLASVYGVVKQHGGFIEVESTVDQGTTFKLYFPALDQKSDEEDELVIGEPVPVGGKETILLAEDDEMVRSLGAQVLRAAGYAVLTASDGEDALELIKRDGASIDLYLLDVIMPGKNGRAVYEALIKDRPEARVLFSSGYSYGTLEMGHLPEGGFELIQKPYSPRELLKRVREMLG